MPVIPHLVVDSGLKALDWYEEALGAKRGAVNLSPDGAKVFHAVLELDGSQIFLCDDFGQGCGKAASKLDGTSVMLALAVESADAACEHAEKSGAKVIMPVQDTFWGARFGMIQDPFGHVWEINQHVRDVSETEIRKSTEEHFAT